MTVPSQLTADLRKLVLRLEDDLRERLAQDDENLARWKAEHQGALDAQRTSSAWQAWRDDKITQAAVAWILTTVFVRFAEDNALVRPVWISGPGARRQEALDAQIVFFRDHPELTDREWLLEPVEYLKKLPATADLVGEHSALWQVRPSGRMATEILEFWRQTDDGGRPSFDLADPELSTRFLGDLYQDLSEYAKKTFALLQTPEFVEEFILDHTLTPALAERPLEGFKLIDPTCGSGHFLLGAFARLTDAWAAQAPGLDPRARVQKALDAVHGVDLNPFAVAIARFRLTVAALRACQETSLELAPAFDFRLAAGDSLLHGGKQGRRGSVQGEVQIDGFHADAALNGFTYAAEDLQLLQQILRSGQYDVVVGNPPYIKSPSSSPNKHYRSLYTSINGQLTLTVPFMERFFGLAKHGSPTQPAGWSGQITSNSFMKREFGSKLIEDFLAHQDLRLVADTSGAYIPGHGTPTVIVIGRHQRPIGTTVRVVLGIRGEPGRPEDPALGVVWRTLSANVDRPSHSDEWISVVDLPRSALASHPWSLSGGGAADVLQILGSAKARVADYSVSIGRTTVVGEDDAWFTTASRARALGASSQVRSIVVGENVRDFRVDGEGLVWWPYKDVFKPSWIDESNPLAEKVLWPFRSLLKRRVLFGKTLMQRGRPWFDHLECYTSKMTTELSITFAEVATHNHFVLDRAGRLFKQTAPIIKLPQGSGEDIHLALLGILNSSTACFWLRETCYDKGGAEGAGSSEPWQRRRQFNGANVGELPLPAELPAERGRELDALGQIESRIVPAAISANSVPTAQRLELAHKQYDSNRRRLIAVQEELDWEVYRAFGMITEDMTYGGRDLPEVGLGERSFEIVMARQMVSGGSDTSWFDRHGSTPIVEIPRHWPSAYQDVVRRRLHLIETNPSIRMMERPEFKRRWASESWEKQQERALRDWLLNTLDDRSLWLDKQGRPSAQSIGQLADILSRDHDFLSILSLWAGTRDVDVIGALTKLLTDEAIPFLAGQRLKDSGLRKYEVWEHTWDLQRREDAGEDVGSIPVPPKYTSADFRKASWWQARGKLDVPKEGFILYPDVGRSTDQTLLIGWAGWNHVEQFLALAAVMDQLVADGAPDEQLIPLVAGMGEILPWIKQWHADIDPAYGVSMADFCAQQFEERAAQIDRSLDQLKAWRPTTPTRGRRTKVTQ